MKRVFAGVIATAIVITLAACSSSSTFFAFAEPDHDDARVRPAKARTR